MKAGSKKFIHTTTLKGFTLVEIMVALMIFSLVVVVALAALVRIVDANRKAQTIQDAVVNLSFSMESMTRELRTGSAYYCKVLAPNTDLNVTSIPSQDISACNGTSVGNGTGVGFAFLSNRNGSSCRLINAYQIVPNMTGTGGTFNGTYSFEKATQDSCGATLVFTPVVSGRAMTITDYYLHMNDTEYPLAFIKLDGNAGTKVSGKTYFTLQTAASPRIP